MTLKEIGVRLTMEGFQREDGGVWYPSLVHGLILSAGVLAARLVIDRAEHVDND